MVEVIFFFFLALTGQDLLTVWHLKTGTKYYTTYYILQQYKSNTVASTTKICNCYESKKNVNAWCIPVFVLFAFSKMSSSLCFRWRMIVLWWNTVQENWTHTIYLEFIERNGKLMVSPKNKLFHAILSLSVLFAITYHHLASPPLRPCIYYLYFIFYLLNFFLLWLCFYWSGQITYFVYMCGF